MNTDKAKASSMPSLEENKEEEKDGVKAKDEQEMVQSALNSQNVSFSNTCHLNVFTITFLRLWLIIYFVYRRRLMRKSN